MTKHMSDTELLDAVEEREAAAGHLATCPECRARAEDARRGLGLAREADVPEPSPLYWEAFRRQVDRRIEADRGRARRWLWLPGLATAAAVALAVAFVPSWQGPRVAPEASLPAWSPLPPAEEDPGLEVLQGLAPSQEELASFSCRDTAACLAGLSDDETRDLAEALRQELRSDL